MTRLLLIISLFYLNICNSQNSELGNYRYVLLGEQTHGDGAVFDEKVKLIKQLHKESNFNTILFESGFYDNLKAWELYQNNRDTSIYNESIFPIWSETKAFQELLTYLEKNPEMKILGVDCQEGDLFQGYFMEDFKIVLDLHKINLNEDEIEIIDKTLVYKDLEYVKGNKEETDKLFALYSKILNEFGKIKQKNFKTRIVEQTFKSCKAEIEYLIKQLNDEKFTVQNPRDLQMADNFMFLQKEFNNERLILWAANYHIANDLSSIQLTELTNEYVKKIHQQEKQLNKHNDSSITEVMEQLKELKDGVPMGRILKEYYKDELFSVGFTSYKGTYRGSHDLETPILIPPETSIEQMLFSKHKEGLTILKNYSDTAFYSSALGYLPLIIKWSDVFDGMYFISEMYVPELNSYNYTTVAAITETAGNSLEKITGVVLARETKTPIPYADIYYEQTDKSVVSNNQGAFMISKESNRKYLTVSAFGYKNDSIDITNTSLPVTFYLEPSQEEHFVLDELVIDSSKKLSVKQILKKARANVKSNYIQKPYNQKFYISIQSYDEKDKLSYSEEALVNTFNENGMNSSSNAHKGFYGEILQYKNATKNNNNDQWSGTGSLWVQLNRDIILSKTNVLYRTKLYDLQPADVVEYDGKTVYKIHFKNNSPGVYSTGYGYPSPESSVGTIYIDVENFAVIRYEHCIVRQTTKSKNAKYPSQTSHKIIETYKETNGQYVLNFFKQTDKTNYIIDGKVIASRYGNFNLMSENIETEIVTKLTRPIIKLKQNNAPERDEEFWRNNNFYVEDNNYKFESCN